MPDVNARMRRYENAFVWLSDAMVANIAYNSTDPGVGLEMIATKRLRQKADDKKGVTKRW